MQFRLGAVLQQLAKPTPLFEHEDEDDFEAPGEGGALLSMFPGVETPGSVLKSPPASLREALRAGPSGQVSQVPPDKPMPGLASFKWNTN